MAAIATAVRRHKSRVGQIIDSLKINKDGGVFARKREGRLLGDLNQHRIENAYQTKWGITRALRDQIIEKYGRKPFRAYINQRAQSRKRNIDFKLSFVQWWALWVESGKWRRRGIGRTKYVMCRLLDAGSYELGNVFIKTNTDNGKEYQLVSKRLRKARAIVENYKSRI